MQTRFCNVQTSKIHLEYKVSKILKKSGFFFSSNSPTQSLFLNRNKLKRMDFVSVSHGSRVIEKFSPKRVVKHLVFKEKFRPPIYNCNTVVILNQFVTALGICNSTLFLSFFPFLNWPRISSSIFLARGIELMRCDRRQCLVTAR